MQDNSQRPHPSITPSSIPPSLYPSTPPPVLTTIHLAVSTSTPSPLFLPSFLFFVQPFTLPPSNPISSPHPSVLQPQHPLFSPSIHPFFLTCLFSSLLWIILPIRRCACNTAVVYNMSVVITDSLAVLH